MPAEKMQKIFREFIAHTMAVVGDNPMSSFSPMASLVRDSSFWGVKQDIKLLMAEDGKDGEPFTFQVLGGWIRKLTHQQKKPVDLLIVAAEGVIEVAGKTADAICIWGRHKDGSAEQAYIRITNEDGRLVCGTIIWIDPKRAAWPF